MSESLPENSFSGVLKVVKLLTGEEVVGLVSEPTPDKILIKLPARLDNYYTKTEKEGIVEYVKLTNYFVNLNSQEASFFKTAVVYIGDASLELQKMYEVYFLAMQTDPKSLLENMPASENNTDNGLQLLNDLFNNEDFVNFVNDLIETYEDSELFEDDGEEEVVELDMEEAEQEQPKAQPKPKKRTRVKPETNKLPYNPEQPPENPESWSDNPSDYI